MWAIAQNALNERADESNQPWQLKVRNAPLCFCNCHSRIYMESVNSLEQEQLVLYLYSSGHDYDYDSPGSLKHRSLLLGFSGWVRPPRISPDKQILKQNLSIATFWFGESIFWQKFPGWNFSPQTLWPLCGMQKHDRGRTQGSPHISGDYLSSQAFFLQWLKSRKPNSSVADPKSVRENTHAQRKKGQVQHFTTSPGWHKRHPHLGCVHLTAWGWSFLLFFCFSHAVNFPRWGILNGSCCCAA